MRSATTPPIQAQWADFFRQCEFRTIPIFGVNEKGECLCRNLKCTSIGKHPMVAKWQQEGHFETREEIYNFWEKHPEANYAVITDGLLVIDVDGEEGKESYERYVKPLLGDGSTFQSSTGKGWHGYYKASAPFKNHVGLFPGIDVRASGGYVVGPGSKHKSQIRYGVRDYGGPNNRFHLSDVPSKLKEHLAKETSSQSFSMSKDILKASIMFGDRIPEGSRNSALASYLGSLVNKRLSEGEMQALAFSFNATKMAAPLSEAEVISVAKSINRYQQRDISPLPLYRETPVPEPFPLEALGEILSPAARALRDSIQAPEALIGQSLLAAASLSVQGHADVSIHQRIYPTSLFLITIGESGERKSAVDREALLKHREYEQELSSKSVDEFKKYQNTKEIYEVSKRNILNSSKKSPQEKEEEIVSLGKEPRAPFRNIMLIEEPTYEGLVKLLEEGRPSVGLFSDEGGRMIGGHGMSKDNLLKTIAGFSSLWNGNPISRTRVGEGSIKLYGKRMALHLMTQPKVAQTLIENEIVGDQGFLSRCLIVYPESTIGGRFYKNLSVNASPGMQAYQRRIKELLEKPLPLRDDSNDLQPRKIELDSRAETLWVEFHDEIEREMKEGGGFESIRGFAAKAAEQSLRIAGVLALFKNIEARSVSENDIESAIRLMKFYLSEAIRIYSISNVDPDIASAQKLLSWCRNHNEVHLVQIYQYGPNSMRGKDTAKRIVGILESHGWLRRVNGGKTIDGKHRADVWEVVR